ncbi:MAG: gliding motility-associated C-terminal domain-containing protein, partial [Chitinophagaceae bacterium]
IPANKQFQVFATGSFEYVRMFVFNQWGQMIFQGNSINDKWDGTYKGKEQPMGVYVYVIRYKRPGGTEQVKKGSITLLR